MTKQKRELDKEPRSKDTLHTILNIWYVVFINTGRNYQLIETNLLPFQNI